MVLNHLTGGGLMTQLCYVLLICGCTTQFKVFEKRVNLGQDILFGLLWTDNYTEVKWIYNHADLIIYWNSTDIIYNGTRTKLSNLSPVILNVSNAHIEDAGNYTLKTTLNVGRSSTYEFLLIVNNTLTVTNSTFVAAHSKCSDVYRDYIFYIIYAMFFVFIIET
nr:glycoprotein vIgFam10 [Elephant endotheliotropic herpesvirus 1A]